MGICRLHRRVTRIGRPSGAQAEGAAQRPRSSELQVAVPGRCGQGFRRVRGTRRRGGQPPGGFPVHGVLTVPPIYTFPLFSTKS
jgi:hypothetical protein